MQKNKIRKKRQKRKKSKRGSLKIQERSATV